MFWYTESIVSTTASSISIDIIYKKVENPTKNNKYVDNNLIVQTWNSLCIALAYSIKALYDIISYPDKAIIKIILSLNKYFISLCSCNSR